MSTNMSDWLTEDWFITGRLQEMQDYLEDQAHVKYGQCDAPCCAETTSYEEYRKDKLNT